MKKIEKQIRVAAPSSLVWDKWTTEDGLRSFFAPDCKMELRMDGPFEMYFLTENAVGSKGSEGCKILSFVPKRMLSFSWNCPPQFEELRAKGPQTYVVIELQEEAKGSTMVTLQHLGWPEGDDWEEVFKYFEKAWTKVLDWLDQSFESE